ncbi:response regulator [Aliikangiella coralliicola]|uniref:Response regulator n=1 Tax=Aliikangiella coralliicola TaxID=2592383 RepID=A0A545U0A8_9GAMM|nr:response regulator [Aliikangiella coralliicola]TQV82899.1 response regulator [Aliikangiella coralliicola]
MDFSLQGRYAALDQSKILVIDDEDLVRESIAIYLEDSGYRVFQAMDGAQGVELFCEYYPDLVLCDLRMPKMDGLEVLKVISEMSPETPIIIVSGAGQIHDVVEALRLGALDYLVKPVTDMAVLENAVINALRRHQLEEQNKTYRKELELANLELERNLELLQQDQEAGRRAQLQLLPEPDANLGGFKFQHIIIPSLNLSGDFIDYFQISERYLGFYIADVSGHGAAAAFVTMTLKSLINQPLRHYRTGNSDSIINPADFMGYLNRELISANLGKHITIFYGVIDCSLMTLTYSVAGQYPAPALVNGGEVRLLKEGGFPIGLFDWANFQNYEIEISSDFQLLMVSDGWLELISGQSGPTGESFLLDYVKDNQISIPSFMRPVKQYPSDNMPDDITVFIVTKE